MSSACPGGGVASDLERGRIDPKKFFTLDEEDPGDLLLRESLDPMYSGSPDLCFFRKRFLKVAMPPDPDRSRKPSSSSVPD